MVFQLTACEVDEPYPVAKDPFKLRTGGGVGSPNHNPFLSLPKEESPPPAPLSTPGPLVSQNEGYHQEGREHQLGIEHEHPRGSVDEPSSIGAHAEEDNHGVCPEGMILVHGDYCPDARQNCAKWMDPEIQKRCEKFDEKITCIGEKKHLKFCVDKYEYAPPGEELPLNDASWTLGKETCESLGKRLCFESEWNLACEGEKMFPYPTGYTRPYDKCNFDKSDLVNEKGKLRDLRMPAKSNPECSSPFGVLNMVGNMDEWVWREGTSPPFRSGMKGGWWLAGRNRCRPATTAHDEYYHDTQSGFRCCKDAP